MHSKTAVKANRVDQRNIDFSSFTGVRCPTELFELSIGFSLKLLVTLI